MMAMKGSVRMGFYLLLVVLCGLLGWWLAHDVFRSPVSVRKPVAEAEEVKELSRPARIQSKVVERVTFKDGATVEIMGSSREKETILRFPTDEAYESFLQALGLSKVQLLGQLDRLRAVRLGYIDIADLDDLLRGENLTMYPAVTKMPDRAKPGEETLAGAEAFNDGVLEWLGIYGDHSQWGRGVKVAVLDTGVVPHEGLPGNFKSIAIEPFPKHLDETHGHGTAVASLIAGCGAIAPGIAPGVTLISVRVSGEDGITDSFSVAAGVLAAMDEGAEIINLSLGSYEDSPLMADAIWLAQNQGIVVVAASGNDGQESAAFPAAYPNVIGVGAVDARGEQLEFSNFGDYLSMTAPGYRVNVAWPGNRYVRLSGTSVSAPLVTGAIAAVMTAGPTRLTASDAAALVMEYADEAGIPGPDSQYGYGILNVGRVIDRQTPGLVDAAITAQQVVSLGQGRDELQVTIQNRGTEILINTLLEVRTSLGDKTFNSTTLAPGKIQTFHFPLPSGSATRLEVTSTLTLGIRGNDQTPANNQKRSVFQR
ncbi:MAG: S8 family serine peptidase [Luteolibacter sp.]